MVVVFTALFYYSNTIITCRIIAQNPPKVYASEIVRKTEGMSAYVDVGGVLLRDLKGGVVLSVVECEQLPHCFTDYPHQLEAWQWHDSGFRSFAKVVPKSGDKVW